MRPIFDDQLKKISPIFTPITAHELPTLQVPQGDLDSSGHATAFLCDADDRRIACSIITSRIRERESHERSEEHTSELQSLMRISYAVFCLKTKKKTTRILKRNIINN